MKVLPSIMAFCLSAFFLLGCNSRQTLPKMSATPVSTKPMETQASNQSIPAGLFLNAESNIELPTEPQISRQRFVKVDLGQLLDDAGQAHPLKEITLNLFDDTVYTGMVEQVEQSGDSISWSGSLKDIENGYFTMVYTSGVFMGHFASPLGVYEVSFVKGDLYRVIQIDQSKLPQGEG